MENPVAVAAGPIWYVRMAHSPDDAPATIERGCLVVRRLFMAGAPYRSRNSNELYLNVGANVRPVTLRATPNNLTVNGNPEEMVSRSAESELGSSGIYIDKKSSMW